MGVWGMGVWGMNVWEIGVWGMDVWGMGECTVVRDGCLAGHILTGIMWWGMGMWWGILCDGYIGGNGCVCGGEGILWLGRYKIGNRCEVENVEPILQRVCFYSNQLCKIQ